MSAGSIAAAPAFGRFFLPGPTDVHPEVLAAMQRPMIGHRSGAMEQLLAGIEAPLARLFRTSHPVLVGTTSATGFMEMAVRNGVRNRALSLVNGSFSERFAKLVRACGKECIRLDVPPGCAVEPDMLRDTLRRTPVDAVTLVHSETSTGVLQDVEALAAVVREFDDVLLRLRLHLDQDLFRTIFGEIGEQVPREFLDDREKLSGRPFDLQAMKAAAGPMKTQWRAQAIWIEQGRPSHVAGVCWVSRRDHQDLPALR